MAILDENTREIYKSSYRTLLKDVSCEEKNEVNIITLQLLGIIDDKFPNSCECGHGVVTNIPTNGLYCRQNGYTKLHCLNDECNIVRGKHLLRILEILNIKENIGEVKCEEICEEICETTKSLNHVLDVFDPNFDVTGCSRISDIMKLRDAVAEINSKGGIRLSTYMTLYCKNFLGTTSSDKILGDQDDLYKFFKKFNSSNPTLSAMEYIGNALKIDSFSDTVQKIANYFIRNAETLLKYEKIFKIKEAIKTDKSIVIAVTGPVTELVFSNGREITRDSFKDYLYENHNINTRISSSFTKATNFVVCDDRGSNTGKAKASRGVKRNDTYALNAIRNGVELKYSDKLVTSSELAYIIENEWV